MKRILAVAAALCLAWGPAMAANYTLTIDGKDYDLDVGPEQSVKLDDGRQLRLALKKKDIVTFSTKTFSFEHPSRLSPSRTSLSEGIHQSMLVSPIGTLVIIQEYGTLDPSNLVDMMINELTKEEVQYGYKIAKEPAERKLADGTTLVGKKVVTSYQDGGYIRYIVTHKGRDSGHMVVTQIDKTASAEEKQIHELFWKTLKLLPK